MSLPICPPEEPGTKNWATVSADQTESVIAAFDAGMSDKRAKTTKRVLARLAAMRADASNVCEPQRSDATRTKARRRLTLVWRVDMRGISCPAPRLATRPRERREQRHTARTTSSGDSGGDGPAAPDLIWGVACPQCAAPLHTDRAGAAHCGGCGITWWEGVR